MKKIEKEQIQLQILNFEALDMTRKKVTKYFYEQYIQRRETEKK